MSMANASVFTELRFWLLIVFSVVVPIGIYGFLLRTKKISRGAVLVFGVLLILIAGIDVYLLQALTVRARVTPSLLDDVIFVRELSVALYLLPALFGGVGVNLVSHVVAAHLALAERRFEREAGGRS
jgi:hypothetical protein